MKKNSQQGLAAPDSGGGLNCLSHLEASLMQFESPEFLVNGLIGLVGLYILAAAPKTGKSFFSLLLCHCVATGHSFLNRAVTQGNALYLALEDTIQRLTQRGKLMEMRPTKDLDFCTKAVNISNGLIRYLNEYMQKKPHTRLIVIDTFQVARGFDTKAGYQRDYDLTSALKEFADEQGIVVLLIHHTKKGRSNDPFDSISGSAGITAAADGMMVMVRMGIRKLVELHVAGRDIGADTFTLCFNEQNRWEVTESREDYILSLVAQLLKEATEWEGTAGKLLEEISSLDEVDIQPNTLSRMLNNNLATLRTRHNILCSYRRTASQRTIKLQKVSDT